MANLEFLKSVLGEELYTKLLEKLTDAKGISLVNAADGSYVPKAKFDAEIASRKQYSAQVDELGKARAELESELSRVRDQLRKAAEKETGYQAEAEKAGKTLRKLEEQVKALTGTLEERTRDLQAAQEYKDQAEKLTAQLADRDKAVERIRKESRISGRLRGIGARNPDVLLRMLDLDQITEEQGKLAGLEEQIQALKASDPYLFADSTAPKGGLDGAPGGSSGPEGVNTQVNREIRRAAGYNV